MSKLIPLLQTVPLFSDLAEDELERIAPLFTVKKFRKGTILFLEGDLGDELFVIDSGAVKIYRIDNSKEIILSLFRDGDYFGEMALLSEGMTRSANAETLEPTVMFTLKRSEFRSFMERSPAICIKLLEFTADRLRKANEQIFDLTFLDVRSRTFKTIARLAAEHGVQRKSGIMINLKLTHQQLANMVGTVRESVTKVLQELQEKGIITIEKKYISVVDMNALKQLF